MRSIDLHDFLLLRQTRSPLLTSIEDIVVHHEHKQIKGSLNHAISPRGPQCVMNLTNKKDGEGSVSVDHSAVRVYIAISGPSWVKTARTCVIIV